MSSSIELRALFLALTFLTQSLFAQTSSCQGLPDFSKLKAALIAAVKEGDQGNGGLGNQEWATVVDRDGIVCAVVFSGPDRSVQWPGSRMIAAEKANTANAFSGPNFALSTANVYASAQPGGSLYGIVTAAPQPPSRLRR